MLLENERQQIVDTCLYMQRHGLVVGTAGNVSVRVGDLVAISPSGVEYDVMTAADVVVTDLAGTIVDGSLKPSSELPLHLAVYHSGPAMAVTHNHAPASTALGLVVDEIPLSHYYSGMFGGPVRVAPFAMFGTDQLAINVAEALRDRSGALMAPKEKFKLFSKNFQKPLHLCLTPRWNRRSSACPPTDNHRRTDQTVRPDVSRPAKESE